MKKNFKIALMSLVLIPCLLLLSACSVGSQKYAGKLAQASEAYFFNHGTIHIKDLTITTTTETKQTYDESVQYDESNSRTEAFEVETTEKEIIEIDSTMNNDATINYMRITRTSKETLNGFRPNEAKTGLEEYTKVTEKSSVHTLVKENDNFKCFVEIEVRVDGVVDETLTKKNVYTFADEMTFNMYVRTLSNSINEKIIINAFFGSYNEYMALGEGNYYSSFGSFGAEFEYSGMDLDVKNDNGLNDYKFSSGTINFENKLKKSGPVKAVYQKSTYEYGELDKKSKINTESEGKLTVSYDEVSIAAPAGFTDTDALPGNPADSLITFSRFLSL